MRIDAWYLATSPLDMRAGMRNSPKCSARSSRTWAFPCTPTDFRSDSEIHAISSSRPAESKTKRWASMVRYADDGRLPLDNNRIENQIRPWAVGRKNWLFAGSFAAAARAADIMTLIQSAKMNGIDPMSYLCDVLNRLPTHPNSRIAELLPTHWRPMPPAALQ